MLAPVALAGASVLALALARLASAPPSAWAGVGALALLAAAVLAEAFPVPVEKLPAGVVSLAAVFILASAMTYGSAAGIATAFATRVSVELLQRRPPIRLVYNGALYALAGGAASLAIAAVRHDGNVHWLLLEAVVGAGAFYAVNIPFVSAIVALWARQPFLPLLRDSVIWTAPSFAIMASVSVMLVALWQRSPALAVPLVGPLIAVGLYQRSANQAVKAMKLALTDPLTGLGNHRHFHERLAEELAAGRSPLAVCLLDLDNFKQINDRYGHPTGDKVLTQVAAILRETGEAFRLGGDEFALLLAGAHEADALALAERVVRRLAADECEHGGTVSFSAGVAAHPAHGADRAELVKAADVALYQAKGEGKNRACAYGVDAPTLVELRGGRGDRAAGVRAASGLARAVEVREEELGGHAGRVGELAGAVAGRLGLPAEQVDLVRLAGRLHDVGKLAIPEALLGKQGPLTRAERQLLERHSLIGHGMLEPLEIEPVATWVLHHHERWDGEGYPAQLAGERIPVGSRILFVADAFDALTSDRAYRAQVEPREALAEIVRCSGTQFDPAVVAAFAIVLDELLGREPGLAVAG